MTKRTPTEGTSADRRKERLADPEDSGHFPADPYVHWNCAARTRDAETSVLHYCDRQDEHDPDPKVHGHYWRAAVPSEDADIYLDQWGTQTLPAVPPQDDGQVADPPATPDVSGETPEPSHTPDVAAGSGERVGRPSVLGAPLATEDPDAHALGPTVTANRPTNLVRPDASEKVLGAAMGVINPVADPSYAIRHAEEQARVIIIGQHWANMLAAVSPPASRLVDDDDVRGVYLKLRQIAATHGIDLDDNGGDR